MSEKTDQVYGNKRDDIKPFSFDHDVASVFEDMLNRSIPFYSEIHRLICDLAGHYLEENDLVYDLGCSTGDTIILLNRHLKSIKKKHIHFIGIDNSKAMIDKCSLKFKNEGIQNTQLLKSDLLDFKFKNSKFIIMNYTLQFISPKHRLKMLSNIYNSLASNGVLILSEKINADEKSFNPLITKLYYDFKKRNGYSQLEISQKREALEKVLIPITPQQQQEQLKEAGFTHVEMIFRWYNFASYLCLK